MSAQSSPADLYALELSPEWRKSRFSADNHCVEVADLPGGGVAVRDSKDPNRPALRFTAEEWHAFRLGVIAGDL